MGHGFLDWNEYEVEGSSKGQVMFLFVFGKGEAWGMLVEISMERDLDNTDAWSQSFLNGGKNVETKSRHLSILLGTNISHPQGTFEDYFSFPKVGYVSSLEGKSDNYDHLKFKLQC